MSALAWVAALLLVGYVAGLVLLYVFQRSLLYHPRRRPVAPATVGFPEAEAVVLATSDGERVIAWHVPPRPGRPLVIYFHGNAETVANRVDRHRALTATGAGLLAVSYRGYMGSTGKPSEPGLLHDADAAYAFAASRSPAEQIVLWGHSLGSGVAVALAAEKPVGRVILEAPFTSAAAVGAKHYWYVPVRLLMTDQFRSDERIGKITAPLLILHGVKDQTVPYAMGEHLFDIANKPKHIVRFLDGGHEDLDKNGALVAVGRFLAGDLD